MRVLVWSLSWVRLYCLWHRVTPTCSTGSILPDNGAWRVLVLECDGCLNVFAPAPPCLRIGGELGEGGFDVIVRVGAVPDFPWRETGSCCV